MVSVAQVGKLNRKALVLGIAAILMCAAVVAAGAYWSHQRSQPSQASAADCALAQKIIDEAQTLPKDETAVAKWREDMHTLRTTKMKDGYLGMQVSRYEAWAANHATGKGQTPKKSELDEMTSSANSHCKAAKRTIVAPPIAS